ARNVSISSSAGKIRRLKNFCSLLLSDIPQKPSIRFHLSKMLTEVISKPGLAPVGHGMFCGCKGVCPDFQIALPEDDSLPSHLIPQAVVTQQKGANQWSAPLGHFSDVSEFPSARVRLRYRPD
ncbi:MAG: hypothetical protein ACK58T_22890, partial [Phycisphaerae bacterium]